MMSHATGQFIRTHGMNTFCIQKGEGTTVLMVHGGSPGACARVNWGANIDFLADSGFAVRAYDQPGYGRTDVPTDYSLDFRVAHAKALVQTLGLSHFYVMGNSQGSYIAARLALEVPGVAKLVLASSGTLAPAGGAEAEELARGHAERIGAYQPSLDNMRTLSRETLFNPDRVTEEFVRERYQMSIGKNADTQRLRRGTPTPRPVYDELKSLRIPTLLMWGAHDAGVAMERSLLLFKAIPGAELHIFDQAAHWVQ